MHGRMSGGLAARAVDQVLAEDPDLICARLTIDMFKSAPLAPMRTSTRRSAPDGALRCSRLASRP